MVKKKKKSPLARQKTKVQINKQIKYMFSPPILFPGQIYLYNNLECLIQTEASQTPASLVLEHGNTERATPPHVYT